MSVCCGVWGCDSVAVAVAVAVIVCVWCGCGCVCGCVAVWQRVCGCCHLLSLAAIRTTSGTTYGTELLRWVNAMAMAAPLVPSPAKP